MTSIKKPLVAIASAVALIGSVLIAGPANAATATLTVNSSAPATAGTSAATAIILPVPADNSVDTADALKIALTNVATGSNVVVSTTNAKVLTSLTDAKASSGSTSLTVSTGTGTTADLFVFTTTTATGSVTVTANNITTTYFVKGTAGPAYKLSVSAPVTVNVGGSAPLTATVVDAFGNAVTNATISSTVIRGTVTAFAYDSTDARYEASLTVPATAGNTVISHTITASAVAAFGSPVTEVISTVVAADLSVQVATLQAEVDALKLQLANATALANTNKDQYNKLAQRWNRKLPGTKWDVKLID
jgi:hypothetical protein